MLFRWDKMLAREKKKTLELPKAAASLSGNKSAAKGKGSAGPSSSGKSGTGQQRPPPARFNGLSVCFGFNTPAGCT